MDPLPEDVDPLREDVDPLPEDVDPLPEDVDPLPEDVEFGSKLVTGSEIWVCDSPDVTTCSLYHIINYCVTITLT